MNEDRHASLLTTVTSWRWTRKRRRENFEEGWMTTIKPFVVGLAIAVLALGVRLPGLGTILTADEPQWIFRSASFTRALATGDLGGTFQGTHPGVVPMLLVGAGVRVREILTGDLLESPAVGAFRTAAKLPVALAVSAAVGLAAALAARLWGMSAGAGAGVFLALDHFFLGHAQLAHVDALLSALMLLSLLTLLLFLRQRVPRLLVLSGFFGGLALLTKLPAVFLFPLTLLVFLTRGRTSALDQKAVAASSAMRDAPSTGWPSGIRQYLLWATVALLTFLFLWPSMWINALPNARYAARDVTTIATVAHGGEEAETSAAPPTFYLRALVARASPVALILALGGLAALLRSRDTARVREGLALGVAVAGFLVLLTFAEKKADRYALPAIVTLDVLAGVALGRLAALRMGGGLMLRRWFARGAGALIVAGLLLTAVLHRPHAVAYESPLAWREEPTQSGWGEGLEAAAALLNRHPLARELVVASWYPAVFREFFSGQTMSLSSRDDPRVSYVVLYRNMRGRAPDAAASVILDEFRVRDPVATVRVLGREVAWVHRTDSLALFPSHVGEIVSDRAARAEVEARGALAVEVGQFVTAEEDTITGARLAFATFSSRANTADVVIHLRENPEGTDLRTVWLNARTIEDGAWRTLTFDPVRGAKGKRYYLAITSPNSSPGNAVTVKYQPRDILPGAVVILRRPLDLGERRADVRHAGDLGVALTYASEP